MIPGRARGVPGKGRVTADWGVGYAGSSVRNKMVIMRTKTRGVSSRVVACQHDDQLVRSGAIRCQPRHRVLGALELVAVADEDQTIRRLVWGREGRKGRSKGNEEEQSHFVQRLSSHTSLLQDAAGLLSPERELPCKSIAVHRLSRSQYTSTQSAGVSTRRAVA